MAKKTNSKTSFSLQSLIVPLSKGSTVVTTAVKSSTKRIASVVEKFPLLSFFGLLALLVVLVVVGDILRKPASTTEIKEATPKSVATYQVGSTPRVTVQAKLEKTGVLTIVAQTSGVVQKLNLTEGDSVKAGQKIVSLSTTYRGANAPSLTRQLSQRNYQHIVDTYPLQLDVIHKNRELAQKNETQSKELRAIGRTSADDTKSLISLNEDIISYLDDQIEEYQATNVGGVNDGTINGLQQNKSQIMAALNGLKASVRASDYTNNDEKEIAAMSTLTKETTLKQLELQEKALELNKDVALLNMRLAQIGESLMYPASPCAGTIERVHVQVGDVVNPGTVIATVRANQSSSTVEALVAGPIAKQVSQLIPATVYIDDQAIEVVPRFVSSEPTTGNLHSVLLTLPETIATPSNGSYITVSIPFSSDVMEQGANATHFIPLDAIYFSQDQAYIYVADTTQQPAVAKLHQVQLGSVYGQMVELKSEMAKDTYIILDRTVVETDPVVVR